MGAEYTHSHPVHLTSAPVTGSERERRKNARAKARSMPNSGDDDKAMLSLRRGSAAGATGVGHGTCAEGAGRRTGAEDGDATTKGSGRDMGAA